MIVKPTGPENAKIVIVGEAPGQNEERLGVPFVGGAGNILNQMLQEAGINRSECYLTNVMDIRPVDNDFGEFYVDKSRKVPSPVLLEGYSRLANEIDTVRPNVVIALGNEALKALTNKIGITKYRGSIITSRLADGEKRILSLNMENEGYNYKVVPTVHPASVMRNWEQRPLVIMDLKRAKDESTYSSYIPTRRVWEKVDKLSTLRVEVKRYLDDAKYISFDIETSNNQVSCIGFAKDEFNAFTVPICMYDRSYWTPEEELEVWSLIKQLLESDIKKIAQNANFDMFFLQTTVGIRVKNLWMDTMNAHHLNYPELPKGLDTLCSIYTREPYYKDMIRTGHSDDYYHYNCLDAMITLECAMAIEKELKEFGMHSFYHDYTNHLIAPFLDMAIRGVRIDTKKRALAAEEMRKSLNESQRKLNEALGYELNVFSSRQMKDFLYSDLGLPLKTHRKTGTVTTNEAALQSLAKTYPNPLFDLILHIRENRKLLSTYLEAEIDPDGRFRCSYILSGTESGRVASRKTVTGTGGNLQNVPKGICREVFIPDEGKMFLSADLSQAEARVVAYLAKDEGLIKIFESGRDIHMQVAANIFDKKEEDITKKERNLAKRIVHASNYGMGAKHLAELAGIGFVEAQDKLNTYHVHFPRIRIWHMEIERQLRRTRILITPLGRKRMFFGRWGDELLRDAYSYIPQSTVADVALKGMLNLYERLPENCELVFNIHDEIVIQVPIMPPCEDFFLVTPTTSLYSYSDEDAQGLHLGYIKDLVVKCMSIPIEIEGRTLTIPVNIKEGMDWQEVS